MTRTGRIVGVTLGLVGAGLIFGALAGGAAFAAVTALAGEKLSGEAFAIGAFFGAPLGAVTAPLLSWLLLRHVPIGRMFMVCSIGTAIGGIAGWFATTTGDIVLNSLGGAFLGCVMAALVLRLRLQRVAQPQ